MPTMDDQRASEQAKRADSLAPTSITARHGADMAGDDPSWAAAESASEAARRAALGRPTLGQSANEANWRVRTTHELDQRARRAAKARGVSLAEFIRSAVDAQTRVRRSLSDQ